MTETEKAYEAIFKVIEKNKDLVNIDIKDLAYKSKCHILEDELINVHGFEFKPGTIEDTRWQNLNYDFKIGVFGGESKASIAWPDCGTQPQGERLLSICCSTGAYMFGGEYDTEFFERFFDELKTHNPKYIDSHNHRLYFTMENGGKFYNEYRDIVVRYHKEYKELANERKVKALKEEIAKLTN